MTEEYNRTQQQQHHVGANWWDMPSSRTSAPSATASSSSSSSSNLTSTGRGGYVGGGGWMDVSLASRSSSSLDNNNNSSSAVSGLEYHPDGTQMQVMGLGLSCHPHHQSVDWNHQTAILEKEEEIGGGFRSMLQEGISAASNTPDFHPNEAGGGMLFGSQMGQWKPSSMPYSERSLFPPAMPTGGGGNEMNPAGAADHFIKSATRGGYSSDQLGLSCNSIPVTCQQQQQGALAAAAYHTHTGLDSSSDSPNSSSNMLQGLIISNPQSSSSSSYGYHPHHHQADHQQESYVGLNNNNNSNNEGLMAATTNWPQPTANDNKVMIPQFLRNTAADTTNMKHNNNNNQLLHFTNNGPFWNSTDAGDGRPGLFFPSIVQNQMGGGGTAPNAVPTYEEKPKFSHPPNSMGGSRDPTKKAPPRSSAATNNTNTAPSPTGMKRSRGEATMPPFKVRKEKMGDRITALQQLVSPFGKTDTASVLSEAIEYIKFLHEQVSLLSTPYLKSNTGSSIQQQQQQTQSCDKSKDLPEGPRRDLRSRGLCLVPISSTFPVAHETSVDFWTPTFGGTFR